MFLHRLLLVLLLLSAAPVSRGFETVADLPENLRMEPSSSTPDAVRLRWNGRAGFSYFIQTATQLASPTQWQYLPAIETGQDAPLAYEVTRTSPLFFSRLVVHPQTATDPYTADFDGDGVSNIAEINSMLDPLSNKDEDEDGLPDDWERFHVGDTQTTNEPTISDQDGDGLSDYDEFISGTDPLSPDTDGDGVLDGADGWPRHDWIRSPPLPEVRYAIMPLGDLGYPTDVRAKEIDDKGNILGASKNTDILRYWTLATGQMENPKLFSYSPNVIPHYSSIRKQLGRNGHVIGGSNTNETIFFAGLWTSGQSDPTILYGPDADYYASAAYTVDGDGNVLGGMIKEETGPSGISGGWSFSSDTWLGATYRTHIYGGGRSGQIIDPTASNETGIFGARRLTIDYDPDRDPADLSSTPEIGIMEDNVFHPVDVGLAVTTLTSGNPVVALGNDSNGQTRWARKTPVGAWEAALLRVWQPSSRSEITGAHHSHANDNVEILAVKTLIRNGTALEFDTLLAPGWTLANTSDINNHGTVLASVRRTIDAQGLPLPPSATFEPALLVPASFIIPGDHPVLDRKPLGAFSDTTAGPRVALEEITLTDISVSDGIASVTVSGEIVDAPMGIMPPGQGGDIAEVVVYINGQETHLRGTVTRANQEPTFWAPYIDNGVIAPLVVTFPARDVATIEIVTVPNALGLTGRAGFTVVFEETTPAPGQLAGVTYSADLIFPATLSSTAIDTLTLTEPDALTGETLVETSAKSGVFANATHTASFTLYDAVYESGGTVAGPVRGRLGGVADLPVGSSFGQDSGDEGQKTAPGSQRYRFSVTRAAQPLPRTPAWQLHEVAMHAPPPGSPARPIGFAAAPMEILKLGFLGEDFTLAKITGHPDQNTAFAITATDKPLLGFVAVREEDPEASTPTLVREFVYYDHTAAALARLPLTYSVGHAEWSIKLGTTQPITFAQKTPAKTIRLVDASGAEHPGFLPVDYENLQAYLDGEDGVTIEEAAVFHLELTGHIPGEVARLFSTEAVDDYFDLVIPGADPLLVPHEQKNTVLQEISPGVYRTAEKVVVYSTPDDPSLRLSEEDWLDLKAFGYVAIHNQDIVIRDGGSMAEWMSLNNMSSAHPPANEAFRTSLNRSGIPQAKDFRYEGYRDHHVFNAYHEDKPKAARWKKVFGDTFDVDAFTIPVHTQTHSKMGPAITSMWDNHLNNYFDSNHNLLPNVDVNDMRAKTLLKMHEICETFNLDASLMRPWPTILRRSQDDTLYKKFLARGGKMGSSADELAKFTETVAKMASAADNRALRRYSGGILKRTAKRIGSGAAVRLMPYVGWVMLAATTANTAFTYTELGWEEALAQQVNEALVLEDIELARVVVQTHISNSHIPGGIPIPSVRLNSTQSFALGEKMFVAHYEAGEIYRVLSYTVVEIKRFPDGPTKIAFAREDDPSDVRIMENITYRIDDYWPIEGDDVAQFFEAERRGMQKQGTQ